ncbi:MAG: tetratricopeptide repeat protein, partial [Acidobacteria bacterium]|nr:tetratricopeptide repeat protein [Acidobacteriota bacterium]
MTRVWTRVAAGVAVVGIVTGAASCATRTTPAVAPSAVVRTPPAVPRDLATRTADVAAYEQAWARIRGGDARAGERALADLLKRSASFYPAAVSLGDMRLERQQYREAGALFAQALSVNPKYLPALVGLVDARLGERDDPGALDALQALLLVDPTRADARSRVEVVGLRVAQSELAAAEKLTAAGQFDEAEARLLHALQATPQNGAVLRALGMVALARPAPEAAEARAREAIALDPQDAAAMALLGDALEAQGRFREAAASYARALAISPNASWSQRREALQARSAAAALPAAYQAIPGATSVTRAQVAALLGVRLAAALDRAPARSSEIVTDARGHWAAAWILP